ncbi:MAG TPA: hypothetical protein EYH49_01475 [Aquifex aeolicus]|nr:hypothetical protein [Aquifex aeolicus]
MKINEDIRLSELFRILPESKVLLLRYGYDKVVSMGVEEVVADKLSLKGFCRLMGIEDEINRLLGELSSLYNKGSEER